MTSISNETKKIKDFIKIHQLNNLSWKVRNYKIFKISHQYNQGSSTSNTSSIIILFMAMMKINSKKFIHGIQIPY